MPSSRTCAPSLHDALPILAELEAAEGAAFDRLFLEMMVKHHEGAIEMAEQMKQDGKFVDAKTLADIIISAQLAEIAEMQVLLGDRKSTRLNSSHLVISYAVVADVRTFPTRRSSDLGRARSSRGRRVRSALPRDDGQASRGRHRDGRADEAGRQVR